MIRLCRALTALLLVGCLAVGLGACRRGADGESSAPERRLEEAERIPLDDETLASQGSGEEAHTPDADDVEVLLYLYRPEMSSYFPVTAWVRDEVTVEALADCVSDQLDLPHPPLSYEQNKGQLILDLDGDYIDRNLADAETEAVFLNSLCATILEANLAVEWFDLRRDGEGYRSASLALTPDEPYEYPTFKIGGGTAAEYAEIRAGVDYPGLDDRLDAALRYDIVPTDATGEELTRFLARIGDPRRQIQNPEALSNRDLLELSLRNVVWLSTFEYSGGHYAPELRPITVSVNDDTVALKEHVELAAEELFGARELVHETVSHWTYHPTEGVYTPPHMGGYAQDQPVILDYEDLGDRYRIELVYLWDGMGAFVDEQGAVIPESDLRSAAEDRLARREVVVLRAEDGALHFYSHRYL